MLESFGNLVDKSWTRQRWRSQGLLFRHKQWPCPSYSEFSSKVFLLQTNDQIVNAPLGNICPHICICIHFYVHSAQYNSRSLPLKDTQGNTQNAQLQATKTTTQRNNYHLTQQLPTSHFFIIIVICVLVISFVNNPSHFVSHITMKHILATLSHPVVQIFNA